MPRFIKPENISALWYLQKQNVFRGSYQFPHNGQNVQGARREGGMLQMQAVDAVWGKGRTNLFLSVINTGSLSSMVNSSSNSVLRLLQILELIKQEL